MIKKLSIVFVLLLTACAPVNRLRTPAYVNEWPAVVRHASLAADSGNYINADRILSSYATQYPRTLEAREIIFWRALFKLDPGNTSGSLQEGLALLDKYIADPQTVAYRPEASILKRLAVTTQVLQARTATVVRDTTIVKVTSEAEVAALRAELVRTKEELERIKKRLANPNK